MKASVYDSIRTLIEIESEFEPRKTIPSSTIGTVIECYVQPECYAVDLAIPNAQLVGGYEYHNVILMPEQFVVLDQRVEAADTIAR